jgi:hypothetical protein
MVDVSGDHTEFVAAFHLVGVVLDDGALAGQHVLAGTVRDDLALECNERLAALALELDGAKAVGAESKEEVEI